MWAHTPKRGRTPLALEAEVGGVVEQLAGEHPVGDDALVVVEVVDEAVERDEALHQPALDARPLPRLDDAGDDVERPCPVDAAAVVVHGERDAHREDVGGCGRLASAQLVEVEGVDDREHLVGHGPGVAVGIAQLVPGLDHRGVTLRDRPRTPPETDGRKHDRTVTFSTHRLRDQAGLGSFGRPRMRSPTMLRWIWLVPPQIVSEREKKNADIIGDTG